MNQHTEVKAKRRKYDESFRIQVLQLVAQGQAVRRIAKTYGVSENLIYHWKNAARTKERNAADQKAVSGEGHWIEEKERLQQQLRQAEQERDILKKALFILSRPT
jgi:transposase